MIVDLMLGKKTNGIKRHLVVDTLGLVLAVHIHTADIQDRDGAKVTLNMLDDGGIHLQKIWADGGYAGKLVTWCKESYGIDLEIIKRSDKGKFVVLPRRWVVERTFGWLNRYRRLSKNFVSSPEFSKPISEEIKTDFGKGHRGFHVCFGM